MSNWDGKTERRQNIKQLCDGHIKLCEDIATIKQKVIAIDTRINGSIDQIEKHIEHGDKWRMTIAGVAVTLILVIVGGLMKFTRDEKQIEVNTVRVDKLEDLHPRNVK